MNKLFIRILLGIFAVFFFTKTGFAATSIRLEQPQTPTYKDTFDMAFVVLDTNPSQNITVQCQKKGQGDADFVNFGSLITLSNGGNTDVCQVNSGIVNQNEFTYQFRAIANGSAGNIYSNSVSVKYNNQAPGTPINYNKIKQDDCSNKIFFRTANDSGKTIKVILYRSTETTFNVDSDHQVNSVNIGSDTDGSITDNVSPNCNTAYYYVIRAFDTYGNGSGVTGDQNVTTNIINPTTTDAQEQGAIPVIRGGAVLGENEDETDKTEEEKDVLGTAEKPAEAKSNTNPVMNMLNWIFTHKKISLLVLIIVTGTALSLYRRLKKRVK